MPDLCQSCGSDLSTRKPGACINADCGKWEGPPDTFQEAAFGVREGMSVVVRQHRSDLPPYFTVDGRLRILFDSWEAWGRFVAALDAGIIAAASARHRKAAEGVWYTVRL